MAVGVERFTGSARSKWMEGTGEDSDIVVSTRIRLARNLEELPFPAKAGPAEAAAVVSRLEKMVELSSPRGDIGDFWILRLKDLPPLDREVLVEKHLISPQLARADEGEEAVALRSDEAVSIMINEEDHLRIQCLLPGLALNEAWGLSERIDDLLESQIGYAFDPDYGYLTSCPTNVGTGLRASLMIRLAGLSMTGQLGQIISATGKVGLMVRGLFGEGTESAGNLFQISNQVSLGLSEEDIIDNLLRAAKQVIAYERRARAALLKDSRTAVEDRVWRAYGILSNARVITSVETISLLSDLSLGIDLRIVEREGLDRKTINELMVTSRPAFLQKASGGHLSPAERDVRRATLIRDRIRGIKKG